METWCFNTALTSILSTKFQHLMNRLLSSHTSALIYFYSLTSIHAVTLPLLLYTSTASLAFMLSRYLCSYILLQPHYLSCCHVTFALIYFYSLTTFHAVTLPLLLYTSTASLPFMLSRYRHMYHIYTNQPQRQQLIPIATSFDTLA